MGEGGMAAILGLDEASVELACQEAAQGQVVAAANYNSPGQVVISGASDALERAMVIAKEKGAKRTTKLPVSVPCHCELLKPAGESLAEEMEKMTFNPLLIPIVQNVNAAEVSNLSELKSNLLAHLHRPVLWSQSITGLVKGGAQLFVECGPGKVLTGLNKRIDKTVKTMTMNDSASMVQVLAELSE
jgi:[acyl-carrier-protein] S-malonyltransferase